MNTYKTMLSAAKQNGKTTEQLAEISADAIDKMLEEIKMHKPELYQKIITEQYIALFGKHYTKECAIEKVAQMHHTDKSGQVHTGEHFTIERAATINEKIVPNATTYDVYVALNTTWHDLHKVLSKWFQSDIDQYCIDTAIALWFNDEDCKYGEEKIWNVTF